MNKKIIVLLGAGLVMLLLLPFFGLMKIDFFNLLTSNDSSFVFWQLRVPRTILGFIAGSSLALAGLIFQNIFKNSLATPYTLGVSTGASAGIVVGIKFHLTTAWLGLNGIYIFGFLGALISITIILGIAKLVKSYSIYTLLMSGVAINFFFSSLIVMVQYLFDFTHTIAILRWLMGGITATGYRELLFFLPIYFFFIFASYLLKNELLIASAGDEFAFSKGLNIKKFRVLFFILVSLVIGILVSFVGPIGFVGLIVPHIARLFFKKDFKSTLFFTIIAGGILLALTDFIARILIHPVEIPVGIITSLMGAPFFLFILISSLRKNK
jgi:iron complex transport system permease protein